MSIQKKKQKFPAQILEPVSLVCSNIGMYTYVLETVFTETEKALIIS